MRLSLLVLSVAALGCTSKSSSPPPVDPTATVKFIAAPQGDMAPIVAAQLAKSQAEKRHVMVYVGATWCQPCRVFHEAVDRGEMTGKIGALDLIQFDGDVDAERLVMADYESQFIPAFTVPNPDGKASARHIEGSVKGDGATNDLAPRIRALLALANDAG